MLFKATTAVLLASTVFAAGPNLDQIFAAQKSAVSAAEATNTATSASLSTSAPASASTKHKSSSAGAAKAHSSSSAKAASKSATRSSLALSRQSSSAAHASSKSAGKSASASAKSAAKSESKSKSVESKHSSSAKSSSAKSHSTKSTSSKLAHSTKSTSDLESGTSTSASASSTPRARFAFAAHHGRGMERKLRSSRHKERDAAPAPAPAAADAAEEVRARELALMKRLAEEHGFRTAPAAARLRRRDADADDVGQAAGLVARSASAVAATASPAVAATSAVAKAASSGYFHGASSYYLHAMAADERYAVLDALKDGGFSVVRIFIASVGANNKGSNSQAVNDVEPNTIGTYDDTILNLVDQLMYDCSQRGLKLLITLGDRYALGWWSTDAYALSLGIVKAGSSGVQQVTDASKFYTSSSAAASWDNRMAHILAHKNSLLGNKPWSQLGSVVYAFEPQNEPQGHMSLVSSSWVCDRAEKLQSLLSSAGSSILVSSGGGITTTTSLDSSFTGCDALDVISVHDYGTDATTTVNALVSAQKSLGSSKAVIMGEWGATGQNKATIVKNFVSGFKAAGIPQMVWEVTSPGKGAADFEIAPGTSGDAIDQAAWAALTGGSVAVAAASSAKTSAAVAKATTTTTTAQWHSSSASWSQHASSAGSSSSSSSSSSAAKAKSTDN